MRDKSLELRVESLESRDCHMEKRMAQGPWRRVLVGDMKGCNDEVEQGFVVSGGQGK